MNIEINLLPEELRPRPPLESRSLLAIVVILALVAGGVFLYMAKAGAVSDRADMQDRVASISQEVQALSGNSEAVTLTKSIANLKAAEKSYDAFVATRIDWGDALQRANELVPSGINVTKMTQVGATLKIEGTSSGYSAVASYGRALDIDRRFVLSGVPFLSQKEEGGTQFTVIVEVAPGGGA
jgi:Tfp pilus assembly protein PilN